MQGIGKAGWQEVLSDGTNLPAQAGTREEVGEKKMSYCFLSLHLVLNQLSNELNNFLLFKNAWSLASMKLMSGIPTFS